MAIRTIGVAFDASRESRHALRIATDLATAARATVRLIRAVMPLIPSVGPSYAIAIESRSFTQELKEDAEQECAQALASLPEELRDEMVVQVGDAIEILRRHANDVDLLVCGSRGYGRERQVPLGSTSARLVDHAECPLLVIPRGAEVIGDGHRVEERTSTLSVAAAT